MATIFEKIGIKPRTLKALIGALLLKFSTSVTTCWGNINLYFLSEFHNQGARITPQTNSTILLISVIPMVISLAFATKLCNRFGYQFIIRICSFVFFISPLINLLVFNMYTFILFSIIIPGSMFALGSVPILNCMWIQFPQSKNKITATLVVAFGIGSTIWNLLFMHMINPNNQSAVQHSDMSFFTQNVTKNVRKTAIIGFAITGIISIIGSWLIQRKQPADVNIDNNDIIQNDKKIDSQQNLKIVEDKKFTFQQALGDQRFIIIMLISFLTGLYEIHLMMNFKIIYMPIVNDDHFLSYCSMLCSVVAIFGAFIWGFLGDFKGVAFTILLLSILDFGSKIFSDFAVTKPTIIVMVVLIGLISKSMTTLAGPGFVEYFGIQMGTQLLPFKGVAILVGYLMVPFFQLASAHYLDPHQYLICISFASVITLVASLRLYYINKKNRKLKQPAKIQKDQKDAYKQLNKIQAISQR